MPKAGHVNHWKHGWIPIDPTAVAVKHGRKTEVVRATVANQKLLDAEMTAQGIGEDHPMRGVLTRARGNRLAVVRQRGKIVGGLAMDVSSGSVGINEVRVLNADQKGGVGTELIRQAAQQVTGKYGSLNVYGAVNSAKPFYVKTGARFTPDSDLGSWSDEAIAALKAGKTPPPGIWHTRESYWAEQLTETKKLYPEHYRELYGTLTPAQVARRDYKGKSGGHSDGLTAAR